jgi:hypothetical protein
MNGQIRQNCPARTTGSTLGLSPPVRQAVKTLPAVRCFSIVRPLLLASRSTPAGEAEVAMRERNPPRNIALSTNRSRHFFKLFGSRTGVRGLSSSNQ